MITPAGSSVQASGVATRRAYAVAAAAAYKKAAAQTIREHHPDIDIDIDIDIVEAKGISGPDFAAEAEEAAAAMLCGHRALAGIWAVWDVPAEGVMAAWESVYHQRPPKDLLEAAS